MEEINNLIDPVAMDPEIRVVILSGEGVDLMTHLDMEASLQSIMIRSQDFQEGVNALIEGRGPQWKRK